MGGHNAAPVSYTHLDVYKRQVMERIAVHLAGRAGKTVEVEAVLFTNERGIIGMTSGEEALIDQWKKGQKDGK